MCAINGFNFKDENLILKMNQITRHRGPDGTGIFLDDEGVSLGHNRLSIIDLHERANQPMKSFDGNQTIVFNGEIYNYRELKKELSDYSFKTESDTEVILASYKKWGRDCVKKFNGIFAFAIWDKEREELFLARDYVGVKPLYYYLNDSKFIFSSEIKAILEHNVPRILNKEALNHYLRVLYVPVPLTMFDGIYKLPPASFAVLKNGNLKIEKYWEPNIKDFDYSLSQTEKKLKDLVRDSVKRQLISDKPLGIYLSGGIDSSVVLYNSSLIRDNIDTFSVGFNLKDSEQEEKFNADFNLAKKTAKFYSTNHHEIILSEEEVPQILKQVVWHMDEPISNPTSLAMFKIADFAKNKVDVVLGGDGGDELFGGYERYRINMLMDLYQKIPVFFRKIFSLSQKVKFFNSLPGIERLFLFMFQKDKILSRAINKNFFDFNITKNFFEKEYFSNVPKNNFTKFLMEVDRKTWLVDESLAKTDKMSMAFGLETRVPLLDKELVEFAVRIPQKYKIRLFSTKFIFKHSFRKNLPPFLFGQPKRGWFSPGAKWLRHPEIYKMTQEILSENYNKETAKIFNWPEIEKILNDHYDKKEYNLNIIWAILVFQIWAKMYDIKL